MKEKRAGAAWLGAVRRDVALPILTGVTATLFSIWLSFGFERLFELPIMFWGLGALFASALLIAGYKWFTPTYRQLEGLRDAAVSAQGRAEDAQRAAEESQRDAEARQRDAEAGQHTARHALQNAMDTLVELHLGTLGARTPDARLSVYSVEGEELVLISRRSRNPSHRRRGRPAYPLVKGVVGEAWEKSSAHRISESRTRDEWERELVETGDFTEREATQLTMMSRTIHAMRLDSQAGEPLGMLVLESTEQNRFTPKVQSTMLKASAQSMITILQASHSEFPRVLERLREHAGIVDATPILVEEPWMWSQYTHDETHGT